MKMIAGAFFVTFASTISLVASLNATEQQLYNLTYGGQVSPMVKVMDMLADMRMKVVNEEKEAYILYSQYTALCDEKHQAKSFLILEDQEEIDYLRAQIQSELADIKGMVAEISELTTRIAKNTGELKALQTQRAIDKDLHEKEIKELKESIDMLKRAISVLSTEKGAALMQTHSAANFAHAMEAMVNASALSAADASALTALVQTKQVDEDKSLDASKLDAVGAPSGEIYESKSGSIIETLSSIQDTAEEKLDAAEKAELLAQQNYLLDETALKNKLQNDKDRLAVIRGDKSAEEGEEADNEGKLVSVKDLLTIDQRTMKLSDEECAKAASDFTEESRGREEEVKVITKAMNVLKEATGARASTEFNVKMRDEEKSDFLQLHEKTDAKSHSISSNKFYQALNLVTDLGHKQNSDSLTRLAMRMSHAYKQGAKEPFKKVKGLIKAMIEKLEDEASNEEDDHSYCVKNMAFYEKEVEAKKQLVMILQGKLDNYLADLAKLQRQLSEIGKSDVLDAKTSAKEAELMEKERLLYMKSKALAENTIAGIETATGILNKYYGTDESTTSTDVVHTILKLLELISVEQTKSLVLMKADWEAAQADYAKSKEENALADTAYAKDKEQLEYKVEDLKGKIVTAEGDLKTAEEELDTVWKLYEEVKAKCTTKADQHAERIAKATAELAGLKEALDILKDETVTDVPSISDTRYALNTRSLRGIRRQ